MLRSALKQLESDVGAVIRQLDEADKMDDAAAAAKRDEIPTVRPPSGEYQATQVQKVDIVKIPSPKGRY